MAVSARTVWDILRDAGSAWIEDNAFRLSAALAFYTLLSVAPLLVIVIAVAGLVFGPEAESGQLSAQLAPRAGGRGRGGGDDHGRREGRPADGRLGGHGHRVVTLLFGASGVFGELQGALNTVWHVKPKPGRGVWRFSDSEMSPSIELASYSDNRRAGVDREDWAAVSRVPFPT